VFGWIIAPKLTLSDEEVKKLQGFLKQYAEVYPEGLATGYFGPLTEGKWCQLCFLGPPFLLKVFYP